MESIAPEFKNDDEKNMVAAVLIVSLILAFIPSLVAYLFCKKSFSENGLAIVRAFLNFDAILVIFSVVIGIVDAPDFLYKVIYIAHAAVAILSVAAIANKKRVEIPVPLKIFQ